MSAFHFIVGSFNTQELYTFEFSVAEKHHHTSNDTNGVILNGNSKASKHSLSLVHRSKAVGSHSWLHLNPVQPDGRRFLYCTGWTEPPSLISYEIRSPTDIRQINSVQTAQRSGYVCANEHAVYSAGAAVGEVFAIDPETGGFASSGGQHHDSTTNGSVIPNGIPNGLANGPKEPQHTDEETSKPIQTVSFLDTQDKKQKNDGSVLDFGGIRHGAHSADLSPSGHALYVADIGRNCIWTYSVSPRDGTLKFGFKNPAPRANDGPRHAWPHPNGKVVYSLQEHSSMVDVFECVDGSGLELRWREGVPCLPPGKDEGLYWADEVRLSLSNGQRPRYLYASNRGLENGTKGYVCAYKLDEDGFIDRSVGSEAGEGEVEGLLHMWETPTSGGWANAVQPGPTVDGVEYVALTDSEDGVVSVLGFDGARFQEVARVRLDGGVGPATAVWL